MSPKQILLILRARYKIAVAVILLAAAGAFHVFTNMPRQYTASAQLVVDIRAPDPISAMLRPSSMATQEDIIKSDRVAQRVVRLLKLEESPAAQQQWREATGGRGRIEQWLGELLQRKLTVNPPRRDSNIMTIEYSAADSAFAAAVANAFAQAYVEVAVELKVEPAKQYAQWFAEQGKAQRDSLERAQARLSEFQQKRGIVARDESVDTETARLAELSSQLTALQAQAGDSRSKQRSSADTLPELLNNPVILGLRNEIVRQEVRMKDAANNLGRNHPRYRSMEAELTELKAKLESETRHAAKMFGSSVTVATQKERELQAAIEAQKRKILRLRVERDQLAVLQREVDAAQRAYDAVVARYTQTSLESQATQTNVFLLNRAVEPLQPSSPNASKFILMVTAFALVAGLGAAFGIEILDRRVRGVEDVTSMLQMPVLSVVPYLPARATRLRLPFRRTRALPAPWLKA
jgi:chain length determinant protein EpsF